MSIQRRLPFKDAFACIIGNGYGAKNLASQVDEAYCFNSIVHGHHVYNIVWTPFLGEILTAM